MSYSVLSSVSNARVKQWASLAEKKGRDRTGTFLVEGPHLVMEVLQSDFLVEHVVYDVSKGIPADLQDFDSTTWIAASTEVMRKCTQTVEPQGIFAVVQKRETSIDLLLSKKDGLLILTDGVRDPGNLGTIIRSADAAGADGIVLGSGTVDVYNPKTVRSTMGSMFHLPIVHSIDLPSLLQSAQKQKVRTVSATVGADNHCYAYDFRGAVWIIVGNEAHGVSEEVELAVQDHISIPMRGGAESLNVAMATTVLLYEALRQREFGQSTKI